MNMELKTFFKQWDKLAHTSISAMIMLFSTAICTLFMIYWFAILVGTGVTAVFAFGKEGYDRLYGGVAEWNDIIADAIGWGLALIPLLIIGFGLVAI